MKENKFLKILDCLEQCKALIIIFFVTEIIFIVIIHSILGVTFLPYATERNAILEKYQVTIDDNQVFYGLNDSELKYINNVLSMLPDDIMISFEKEGWNIVVSDEIPDITNLNTNLRQLENVKCMGFVDKSKKIIFLRHAENLHMATSLVHELGHYSDKFSREKAFCELYEKYKDVGYTGACESPRLQYALISRREFFATTFKDYFLFPSYLKETAPDVYQYFSEIF